MKLRKLQQINFSHLPDRTFTDHQPPHNIFRCVLLIRPLPEHQVNRERYLNRRAVDYSNVEGDWLSFHWSGSQAESWSACVVGRLTSS